MLLKSVLNYVKIVVYESQLFWYDVYREQSFKYIYTLDPLKNSDYKYLVSLYELEYGEKWALIDRWTRPNGFSKDMNNKCFVCANILWCAYIQAARVGLHLSLRVAYLSMVCRDQLRI